jgi:hypothetical protein
MEGYSHLDDDFLDQFASTTNKTRKRDRENLAFKGIGEDDVLERLVEIRVHDKDNEIWQHKTLYCLCETQDEESNPNRLWVQWRGKRNDEVFGGRVAIMVRTRDWKPQEPKYRLKQYMKDAKGGEWRTYLVGHERNKKLIAEASGDFLIDASKIRINFRGQIISLQEAVDTIDQKK